MIVITPKFKKLKNVLDISNKELAERLDVDEAYVSRLLSGKDNPSARVMDKACEAFKPTIGDLFDATGE